MYCFSDPTEINLLYVCLIVGMFILKYLYPKLGMFQLNCISLRFSHAQFWLNPSINFFLLPPLQLVDEMFPFFVFLQPLINLELENLCMAEYLSLY